MTTTSTSSTQATPDSLESGSGLDVPTPWDIRRPSEQTAPVVFASPHSGRVYPQSFVESSRLTPLMLRRSEDAFVDELFAAAPDHGVPLLRAHFPRAYVDPNREAYELDPDMFEDPLPGFANTSSPRITAGLGTVAKVVTSGENIYRERMAYAEAENRIETCYKPYHQAMKGLIDETRERFGHCLLIDCHSMPSIGGPMDRDPGFRRVDMVLGDNFGQACATKISRRAEEALTDMGYRITRNNPYAGGFTTQHYGQPDTGVHALQIEINRGLYMDELRMEPGSGMTELTQNLTSLIKTMAGIDPGEFDIA